MVELVAVTDEALMHLAAHMRAADLDEVHATGYADPLTALREGVEHSSHCAIATVNGVPAAIIGLAPVNLLTGQGAPWMLGTDAVTANRRALMTYTGPYIRTMLKAYPHLVNYVHASNRVAVNWLRRIGFEIGPAQPYGPHGALFHRFEMKA